MFNIAQSVFESQSWFFAEINKNAKNIFRSFYIHVIILKDFKVIKVSAVKNSVYRATQLRQGNGISRLYHNSKILSRRSNTMAVINALFAFMAAHNKWWFNVAIMTLLMWAFAKKGEEFRNIKLDFYEHYQPILERVKQIHKR